MIANLILVKNVLVYTNSFFHLLQIQVFFKYGIDENVLLSYISDTTQQLEQVPLVTNELIFNLVKFKHLHPKCTYNVVYRWIKDVY